MSFQRLLPILLYVAAISAFTSWKPWQPLFLFQGRPILMSAGFLILFVALRKWMPSILAWLERQPAWLLLAPSVLMVFGTSLAISQSPTRLLQFFADETCYTLMARMFSQGSLWLPAHDFPPFFQNIFQVMDDKWYTLFQPGFPLVLSLGMLMGIGPLVDPLLTVLAIWLTYRIALDLFDKPTALLTALLLAFSPMITGVAAMMLNHCLSLVMGLLTVWCVVRLRQEKKRYLYPLIGALLGYFFWVRGLTAVGFGIPVAVWMLYLIGKKELSLRWALTALPVGLLFVGLHFGYNAVLTGDALTFPQDHFFAISEMKPHCHDLGFGKGIGCSFGPSTYFENGYWPSDVMDVYYVRMPEYLLYSLGFVSVLYFFGLAFYEQRQRDTKWFLLSLQVSLILIYGLFFFHGGAGRYYLEGLPYLLILIVRGLLVFKQWADSLSGDRFHHALARYAPASIVLGFVSFNGLFMLPVVDEMLKPKILENAGLIFQHPDLIEPDSVVFVTRDYHTIQLLNEGTDLHHSKPLFARDRGSYNSMLMRMHPDRHYYRYDPKHPAFVPIADAFPESVLHIEAEVLPPVPYFSGEWLHAAPLRMPNFDEAEIVGPDSVLMFEAQRPGSFFGFRQRIFKAGVYSVEARFQNDKDRGKVVVEMDGVPLEPAFDGYADISVMADWKADEPLALSEGVHVLSLRVVGKNHKSSGHGVAVDWIRLTRTDP